MSAPDIVRDLLHARPSEYRRPCPNCDKGPRDVALAIRIDERGATWFCHRCHFMGAHNRGRDARTVAGYRTRAERPAVDVPQRWSERADRIWKASRPLAGSLGEVYLHVRHCVLPPADGDLRYLPPSSTCPAPHLIGRITDFVTNEPMSLHFTRLRTDGRGKAGTARDKLLLRGHQKKGGIVRLWSDEAVTLSLALAEGIESALSAARFHRAPIWSAIDAGNLGSLPVVEGIEDLTVFADHDAAGIEAAQTLVTRWRRAGISAKAFMPIAPGADPNDVARGVA